MNIHITLDYELFFGNRAGTVEKCMLEPTRRLLYILTPLDIKATFYVDIGYIERAYTLGVDLVNVEKVISQLNDLNNAGHDLQLHIHPHWEDAEYAQEKWVFDMKRYRLALFTKAEAADLVTRYVKMFTHLGLPRPSAYRAGGWCIQPFEHFSEALYENGIKLDSTVYNGGHNKSYVQYFDFRHAPSREYWRFHNDPCEVVDKGRFYELPISSHKVSPLFFWKFALAKKFGGNKHLGIGDGSAVKLPKKQMFKLLLSSSNTVASIDGYKASLLNKYKKSKELVLIGHPKAFTEYSLEKLQEFVLVNHNKSKFLTAKEWLIMQESN